MKTEAKWNKDAEIAPEGAEVPRAWITKGEVLLWKAVSSKSTSGNTTISSITAKVPSRTIQANELIFLWRTTLKSYFPQAVPVNRFLKLDKARAIGRP